MTTLSRIADRIFNRPLLIHPGKLEVILVMLGERVGVDPTEIALSESSLREYFMRARNLSPAANRLIGEPTGPLDSRGRRRLLYQFHNGVALIPIVGSLINRGAFVGDDGSGAVSYEGLAIQIAAAADDPAVRAILLDIDSPGGEANGMTALAETIRAARQRRHVTALVNDMAASAAYGLAAQADDVVISPTSITGSIGVVMLHLDHSKQLEKKGIAPTFIYAGAHKIDGNPLQPLTDAVRADLQADVDSYYNAFVKTVADGRQGLTEEAIRKTEAKIFVGATALDHGLADRVGSFSDTLAGLSRLQIGFNGGPRMENVQSNFGEVVPLSQHEAAVAAAREAGRSEGRREGIEEGIQQGFAAAMERVNAILTCEAAKDRLPYAIRLALGKMDAKEAIAMLAELPAIEKAGPPPIADRATLALSSIGIEAVTPPREQIATSWSRVFERKGAALR